MQMSVTLRGNFMARHEREGEAAEYLQKFYRERQTRALAAGEM
jgi:hypothetical protein